MQFKDLKLGDVFTIPNDPKRDIYAKREDYNVFGIDSNADTLHGFMPVKFAETQDVIYEPGMTASYHAC